MKHTSPLRRALGVALTALLASAALALAAPVVSTASATSNAANAKTIFNAINTDRGTQSLAPFLDNTLIDAHTQSLLGAYIKCGYTCVNGANPSAALPNGWTGGASYGAFVSSPATVSHLASYVTTDWQAENRVPIDNSNYIGVGYEVKGSRAYAYVLFLKYSPNLPLDRLTATLPSHAVVGTPIVPVITSVTPGVTYDYLWWRAGSTSVGTGPTYTPTALDVGHTISVVVNATKTGYISHAVTTNSTGKVGHGTIVAPHSVSMSGHRNVGQQLTAGGGGWGPAGVVLSAQWYRNGAKISGAIFGSYTLQPQDLGKRIDVRITGTLAGYTTKYVQTHTAVKTGLPLQTSTPVPTITAGTYFLGSVLTAHIGTWDSGVATSITWKIAGKAVSGAHATTFTLPASAVNHTVTVSVTGKKSGFATATTTSVPTTAISGPAFDVVTLPVVTGSVVKGHVLSVTAGKFSPTPSKTSYRWYRNGVPISGATTHTHTVTSSDVGKTMTVSVTVTKTGWETLSELV